MTATRLQESIGSLTKTSSTQVSLAASRLNIAGQQYVTSALTLNTGTVGAGGVDATLIANAFYYVYAVFTNGSVYLIGSTNSSLPSGYTSARVVGNFYTDPASYVYRVLTSGQFAIEQEALNNSGNFVIGGGFDFWNRGTSFAVGAGNTNYTADMWKGYDGNSATTVTQVAGSTQNAPFGLKSTRNSGSTSTAVRYLIHIIESKIARLLAGKTVTLSFRMKAGANFSGASSVLVTNIQSGTGTDENNISVFTGAVDNTQSNTLTTSFQTFTHTLTLPTSCNEIAMRFNYTPVGTAGADDSFTIETVMLNEGPFAAPFRRAGGTIGGEQALCDRYFQTSVGQTFSVGILMPGAGGGTSYSRCSGQRFRVPMRAAPVVTIYNGATANQCALYSSGTAFTVSSVNTVLPDGFDFFNFSPASSTNEPMGYRFTADASI